MLKTSLLFLRNNLRGYRSIFVSIVIFIFIINIVSIFLIGMSFGLKEQVIDNDNLNILELYPKENQSGLSQMQLNEIKGMDGVLGAYYTEGASLECQDINDSGKSANFSVFKLDNDFLQYYGLPASEDEVYFYGNTSSQPDLKVGDTFDALKNALEGSSNVTFTITNTVVVPENISRLIPGDVSFVDPITFDKLLHNSDSYFLNDQDYSARLEGFATIHVIVPDVTKQNNIAQSIRTQYPNMKVSYILESATKLPSYVDTFVKIGYVLLVILLIFYFLSIHNNISHMLNFRSKGISLFDVLGVEHKKIVRYFYCEFIILGLIAWLTQLILTVCIVFIASTSFNIALYHDAIIAVLIGNIVLIIASMGISGYMATYINIKKIINHEKSASV